MFPTQFTSASFTWERKKLGEIGSVSMNKRIFKDETSTIGEIPFYKIGTFGGKADAFITRKKYEEYKKKYPYPQKGNLLISASGSIGRIIEYNGEEAYYQDSNIVWLDHDNTILDVFLKPTYEIIKWDGIEGTTIKRLYNKNILNTVIYKPTIDEQRKIGKLFIILNNTIQLHEDYLQLLYDFRSFLLQKMFSINDTFPNLRFKQFNDKWKYKKLGEVADIVSGGTPDTTKHDYWNGSINWYTPAEVGNKIFVSDSQRKITNIGLENSSAKILPVGTVLFTSRAGIGKTAILKEKGSTNQGFQSIVPKQKFLDSYFIFSMSNILKKYGESHGAGSTFLEISGKELAKARISLPSITEQKNISKVLFKLDTIITLQKQEIDNLKKLKQFLLQNMFI
ncbi:restriction endonuclease subunit S [Ligilactobacillus salivarius]|uniref:restriction endonuclease subunit S n=2 Tax=Ligilactobacillus salivarius TaxID=1624 RepID=UPI0009DA5E65|nr:restriction endonuclease subunit S [Ligilactobacillus salivarius]OQQ76256.1 restriction endonuclease subunit S [Ligilactobacillus salivarius]OQQ76515.1 restriction endonuclease subunit S [Ligilactobacillus salivarius]OQQ98670.1 restriction endonuclease subunit S [Ligilactobacillus salivarius]OQR20697.1 restriction endonuclease subunit S [Ligilactobacillus salivarius]